MPNELSAPTSSTAASLSEITSAARRAAAPYAAVSPKVRAGFLDRIAERLEELGDELIQTAHRESNLPIARLTGERGRTCSQLRMFANLIRSDAWLDIRIETADPARTPIPKPDLRRTQVPLGPVAVFGASNFPLAFSVPGGDTASALAAGCPVVVKAHPAHPETSRLAAEAILGAVSDCAMPDGTFGIVLGGVEEGRALVLDPNIYAVGFTGSFKAGKSLFDLAAGRPRPIPVYAEMGSVNPVFVFPGALDTKAEDLAKGYAGSLTLGVGQFCTNPGVVVGVGPAFDAFVDSVATHLSAVSAGAMLHPGIQASYEAAVQSRSNDARLHCHLAGGGTAPALFSTDAQTFIASAVLREEAFGPTAIAVKCQEFAEMHQVAEALEGQLTATVLYQDSDVADVRAILPTLVHIAGRIVANGFPTGVEVNTAMQHGGPYPSTTDSRVTSVGTAAILRFVRPVAFQDFPDELLPEELKSVKA